MVPETRYTQSEGINVAYQVFGQGPLDLVVVPGWVSNIEVFWEEPSVARFFSNLASFSRVILFDKRGTGLSDRVVGATTLEQRMDDVRAVMDAAASKRVALFGYSEGGPMSALFAATYPARTSALIMLGSYARRTRAPDYPYGPDDEHMQAWFDLIVDNWGGPVGLEERAPTLAQDDRFRLWWARYLRLSASPSSLRALTVANGQIDVRHVLPSIRVPTLILHADKDQAIEAGHSYYLAKAIPNAKLVLFDCQDHLPYASGADAIVSSIQEFLTGVRPPPSSDSLLCTKQCPGRGRSMIGWAGSTTSRRWSRI